MESTNNIRERSVRYLGIFLNTSGKLNVKLILTLGDHSVTVNFLQLKIFRKQIAEVVNNSHVEKD